MNEEDDRQAELPDFATIKAEIHQGFDAIDRLIIRGGLLLFGTMLIGFISLAVTMIFTQP